MTAQMQEDQTWRTKVAWRAALAAVVLNLVGMPIGLLTVRSLPGATIWPGLASMGMSAAILVPLLLRRRRPTVRLGNFAFLANMVAIPIGLWFVNMMQAESGRTWVPFQANKLGVLTIGLLAPELWVGLVSILGFIAAPLVQLTLLSSAARAHLAVGEPGATLAFGVFAAVLLVYRLRRMLLERDIVRTQAEKTAMVRFAKVQLAVRDLSNSPLQTITFASAAARLAHPELAPILDPIDHALADLKVLDGRLREYESALTWAPGEESFDALGILRKAR